MTVAVVVLAALLAASVLVSGLLADRLRRARAEVAELEVALARPSLPLLPRASSAVQAAGRVARTLTDTTRRVREQGVGGMMLASLDDFTRWALEDDTAIRRIAGEDGTVTILFSDIVDSTALNASLGDERWVALLAEHDRIVRSRVERHGGHVVKSQGDGFMIVFGTPSDALRAALSIQRKLASAKGFQLRRTPIRVRMGVHTGAAIERDGDWFGANVAKAARVAALADGGEVLVTAEVADTLTGDEEADAEGADVTLAEAMRVELRGLPGEHTLWLVT